MYNLSTYLIILKFYFFKNYSFYVFFKVTFVLNSYLLLLGNFQMDFFFS
jgi:hypothetical protein